jgi:branched-chain amino acid transport system permease protein
MSNRFSPNTRASLFALAVLVLIGWVASSSPLGLSLPALTGGLVNLDTIVRVEIFSIVLVGLNLLMGYAGQVSLGQASFYGLGAFFSAILTTRAKTLGIPVEVAEAWWYPWLVMLAGMLIVGGVAYLVGQPVLKLRGHYLAMATLGLGEFIVILLRENLGLPQMNLTGGFDGVTGIPRLRIGEFVLWPLERYYVFVSVTVLLVIVVGLNIVNSRMGRTFRAIHGSQVAAESVGIAVPLYKARVFALSAALASLAGSLYAHFQTAVIPATFGFGPSLALVTMSAVGGLASIWGAPFGVFVILLLQEIIRTRLKLIIPNAGGEIESVAFGLLLILIMIFLPEGLTAGVMKRIRARRAAKRMASREAPSESPSRRSIG